MSNPSNTYTLIKGLRDWAVDSATTDSAAKDFMDAANRMDEMAKLLNWAVDIVEYPTSTSQDSKARFLKRAEEIGFVPCPF